MRRLGGAVVLVLLGGFCAAVPCAWSAGHVDDAALDAAAPDAAPAPTPADDAVAGAPAAASSLGVRDVRVEPAGDGRRLVVTLTRVPDGVHNLVLKDPPRLVVDVRGPQSGKANGPTRFPVRDDVVSGVRVAPNNGALRVVADLRAPAPYKFHAEGNTLVIDVAAATAPAAEHAAMAKEAKPAPSEPVVDAEAAPPAAEVPAVEPKPVAKAK